MDHKKWNDAVQVATVDSSALALSVERALAVASEHSRSSLSGVMFVVREGADIEVFGTDGGSAIVARFALQAPVEGLAEAVYVVPSTLAATLRSSFAIVDGQQLRLGLCQDPTGQTLLVGDPEQPDRTLIQPLWDAGVHVDLYNEKVVAHAPTTTAQADRKAVEAALASVSGSSRLTIAAMPGRLLLATSAGASQPIEAAFRGAPVRLEVERADFESALRSTETGLRSAEICIGVSPDTSTADVTPVESDISRGNELADWISVYLHTGPQIDRSGSFPGSETGRPAAFEIADTPPADGVDAVLEHINSLPGLESVKEHAALIVKQTEINNLLLAQGLKGSVVAGHLVLAGPPGAGKSLAAEQLARLYKALGLLPESTVVEVNRATLLEHHTGGGQARTAKQLIDDAMGGVLLIDEAFDLAKANDKDNDVIQSIIEEVRKAVAKQRGEFVCIIAGTEAEMEQFLASNLDLRTNFTKTLILPPYRPTELLQITTAMVESRDSVLSEDGARALEIRLRDHERRGGLTDRDWANAKSIINLVDAAVGFRNVRVAAGEIPENIQELVTIQAEDIDSAADLLRIGRVEGAAESLEDILAELDALTGQPQLKAKVRSLLAAVQIAQAKEAQGLASGPFFLDHMLFVGPPGTGKTTIARLLARLYRALGILPKGHVIEVDHGDLKGEYEGHSAVKTTAQIDRAMGGVMLIDEAYQLVGSSGNDKFGLEVVATLLKRMEDDKGKFLVIATGYPEDMKTFLKSNVGLPRRFGVLDANTIFSGPTIEFTSYTAADLFAIATHMAKTNHNTLTEAAAGALESRLESAGRAGLFERPTWGNAGSVRNLVEASIQARDLRVAQAGELTRETLTVLEEADVLSACDQMGLNAGGSGEESVDDVLAELDAIVGQPALKREIKLLLDQVRMNQALEAQGLPAAGGLIQHMVFAGPPGTGKTTVARIIARLYKALGLLPFGNLIEVTRNDLVAGAVGQTATKTAAKFDEALGGVLFIDEAYALSSGGDQDFGKEAIDTLVPLMENKADKTLVIAAGYTGDMVSFIGANPGLASRFTRTIEFESYNAADLSQIADGFVSAMNLTLAPSAKELLDKRLAAADRSGQFGAKDWGNARVMRQVVQRARKEMSGRIMAAHDVSTVTDTSLLTTLIDSDVQAALDAQGIGGGSSSGTDLQSVLAELDAMIGQPQLKQKVREIIAAAQAARARSERGLESAAPTLNHMLFVGPPGTGKTTVARLIAKLYGALGLLPKGHLVEVDRSGLVVGYVGQTAKKTNAVVDQAMGGVLFIDEAYALVGRGENDFGGEAIDTLLKRLSDDEGHFLSIAAGYAGDMDRFVRANDGLPRRFSQRIEFVPYTSSELLEIAVSAAFKAGEVLEPEARDHLARRLAAAEADGAFEQSTWGNAGSVINIVRTAVQKRDLRVFGHDSSAEDLTTLSLPDVQEACDQAGLSPASAVPIAPVSAAPVGPLSAVPAAPVNAAPVNAAPVNAAPVNAAPVSAAPVSAAPVSAGPTSPAAPLEQSLSAAEPAPAVDIRTELEAVLTEFDAQPIRSATKGWIRSLGEKALAAAPGGAARTLSRWWRFEGNYGPQQEAVAALLARFYRVVGVTETETVTPIDVGSGVDLVHLEEALSLAAGGAVLITGMAAVADADLAQVVRELIRRNAAHTLVILADTPAALTVFLEHDARFKSEFRWSIVFDGARQPAAPSAVAVDIAALVGEVAEILAPGAKPGAAVPSGTQLAAVGVEEVYWQRARSGGGGGMGIQMRLRAGSKDRMYYFAGGSDGRLPAMFESAGESIPKGKVRDLLAHISPQTFREWQARPEAAQVLADQILAGITADHARGPIV